MPHNGWVEGQVLPLPQNMDTDDEITIREAVWWNLNPGEVGYNQPLHAFLGFTEDEWRRRQIERGFRR